MKSFGIKKFLTIAAVVNLCAATVLILYPSKNNTVHAVRTVTVVIGKAKLLPSASKKPIKIDISNAKIHYKKPQIITS